MKRIRLIFLSIVLPLFALSQMQEDRSCLECHLSGSWFPLSETPSFDHNQATDFRLLYKHADLACTQCHSGNTIDEFHSFSVKGSDCVNCHQDIHQNYWGNDCEACHSAEAWDPAMAYRRHNETLFPLLAAHQSQSCYFCHTTPGMVPSLDCQECHARDFSLELPAHVDLSPQTDCSNCHAPTRWDQILAINHDVFFPIYSGQHRGEWDACSDCHEQSGEYQAFTCFGSGCHDEADMNDEHCEGNDCERRNGLTYPRNGVDSNDCYFCHPRGNE